MRFFHNISWYYLDSFFRLDIMKKAKCGRRRRKSFLSDETELIMKLHLLCKSWSYQTSISIFMLVGERARACVQCSFLGPWWSIKKIIRAIEVNVMRWECHKGRNYGSCKDLWVMIIDLMTFLPLLLQSCVLRLTNFHI